MVSCDFYRKIVNVLIYLYALSIMCERIAVTYFVPVSNYIALPLIMLICFQLMFAGKLKKTGIGISILALWTWILIGMLWTFNLEALIIKYGLVTLLMLVALCIIQRGLNDKELRNIEIVCFIGGLLTAITLLMEGQNFYGNMIEERLSLGRDNDPNFYAMTLLYAWAIGYQYIYEKNKIVKIIGLFGMATLLYAIVMLGSRGGLLACIVTMIAYEIYQKHYRVLIMLLTIVGIIMTWLAGMFERFTLEVMMESGGAGRTDIWLVGWEMIKDNLFQGVGLHNFEVRYNEYAVLSETGYFRGLYRAPHNFLIEIFAELGLIGLILYLYLYLYAIKKYVTKMVLRMHPSLINGILSTFIAALFLTTISEKIPWFLLAVIVAYGRRKENV